MAHNQEVAGSKPAPATPNQEENAMDEKPQGKDISAEVWREYEWPIEGGQFRTYHIDEPVTLFTRPGGTTHRVLDAYGIVHCVPAVGELGCVLRWKPKDAGRPVQF